MPRNYSNKRCHNCQAYGHLKYACPSLRPMNVGVITVHPEGQNQPSASQKKFKGILKNNVSNSQPIAYLGGITVVSSNDKKSFVEEDSDSDDDDLDYCNECYQVKHDGMPCYAAMFYKCHICDETGHFEDKCSTFLKEAKKQENYDKKWRKKWGMKIVANKKCLESMPKPSKSGMQCDYCYSVHHDTSDCFLTPYGIKEDLKL